MHCWYLIYTKSKNEDAVSEKLSGCGLEIFNPKFKERKFVRRKIREVISPLFPCYIFANFEFPKDFHLVKYTRGVKKVIGNENSPIPVPPDIIDSIRGRIIEGLVKVKSTTFMPGDEVVIKDGPFQGLVAVFERKLSGVERVSVLLKTINYRVVLDGAFLSRTLA